MSMVHRHSRVVGYGTILLAAVLAGMFVWHLRQMTNKGQEYVLIRFDGSGELIGALQPDDPVLVKGVDVGQVENFVQVPGGVRVLVRFWGHQPLFRDAYAVNTSYSLMGQRVIALNPGNDSLHPLDKNSSIPGIFDPGIAEVMSQIYKVLDAVISLRRSTVAMVRGDSATEALHKKLMGALDGVDKTISGLEKVANGSGKLGGVLDQTSRKTRAITREFPKFDRDLRALLASTDSVLKTTQDMLQTVRPAIDSARSLAAKAADSAGPMRHVLLDDSLIVTARRLEASLNTLMTVLEGELPMKFRFHVLGSNPSKKGQ